MASPFLIQIRIADELQANVNIASHLRECLENQMSEGLGTRTKTGTDKHTIQMWRDVVKAMADLTTCQVKLQRNAKLMAEKMTPEEELDAVRAYLRALPNDQRALFLLNEQRWHQRREDGVPERPRDATP